MIFERVICGVDPSEESIEAARQAARLATADGKLVLAAVAELEVAVQAGFAAATVAEELQADAGGSARERPPGASAGTRVAETRL